VKITPRQWMIGGASAVGIGAILWWLSRSDTPTDGTDAGTDAALTDQGGGPIVYDAPQYKPFAPDTIALFTDAALAEGLPKEWATAAGLHNILLKESGGWVGIPNYQFGEGSNMAERGRWVMNHKEEWPVIWAALKNGTWQDMLKEPYASMPRGKQSSATGLGQMTLTNIKGGLLGGVYPNGVDDIGDAMGEARGMLKYIATHKGPAGLYNDPDGAWAQYGQGQEGY
jgi:hypothetical protein